MDAFLYASASDAYTDNEIDSTTGWCTLRLNRAPVSVHKLLIRGVYIEFSETGSTVVPWPFFIFETPDLNVLNISNVSHAVNRIVLPTWPGKQLENTPSIMYWYENPIEVTNSGPVTNLQFIRLRLLRPNNTTGQWEGVPYVPKSLAIWAKIF